MCDKHTARIKVLEEEQKIIQDQLDNVGTDWLDIRSLHKTLKNKRKVEWKASETIVKGLDRLSAQEGLQQQLQAFIEGFDLESREEQVEEHKSLSNDVSIIERHIRTNTMEIGNYQNKIDLLHDHEYDPDCVYCSNNQFVKEAEEAKTLIEESRQSLRTFEEDLRTINKMKDDIDIVYIKAEIADHNVKTRRNKNK